MEKSMFQNKVWHTPLLPAIPDSVAGEAASVRLANRRAGEWSFLFREIADIPSPHAQVQDYPFDRIAPEEWKDVIVPSALTMQGYDIKTTGSITIRRPFPSRRILRGSVSSCALRAYIPMRGSGSTTAMCAPT